MIICYMKSNGYYERRSDNNIDRGGLKARNVTLTRGVGGSRFVTMRYKGWVVGRNRRILVLRKC